ncbi:MAG: tRNA pseudouridine(55) synthase TruB [Mariprofundales bacterium]
MSTSGVVFLDKPLGWSSRKAVNAVARLFGNGKKLKAGHTGTLDPLATGMLPILLGSATRFAAMGLEADKVYVIELDLAHQTDTLDMEGEVVARFECWQDLKQPEILQCLQHFLGTIDQIPPRFSAIRIDGQRSHHLARRGQTVAIPARTVTIHAIDLLHCALPKLQLRVRCSKGTYMRALARDIGDQLGCGGCITELRRLQTGGWDSALMVSMDQLDALANGATDESSTLLHPTGFWLRHLPRLELNHSQAARIRHGQRIALEDATLADSVVFFYEMECLGIGKVIAGNGSWPVLHPARLITGS